MKRLRLDRDGDLAPVLETGAELVVDASGPFQAMQAELDDPWRVARFCIAHGLHYLDLSDDADFTAGMAQLDAPARAAGVVVLSGVSSVPALSSAAVVELRQGMTALDVIEIAILPGNRAPRGRAVVEAIMRQAGTALRVWRGGRWVATRNWSESRPIRLTADMVRRGWMQRVPDTVLLPEWSGARSVLVRAGMELPLLNLGLSVLGLMRRWGVIRKVHRWQVSAALQFARLLRPLGSDRGGMLVEVTGEVGSGRERRSWVLLAETGEGPFVPTIPVRTLLRRFGSLPAGAGPCLAAFTLAEAETAMADLEIVFHRSAQPDAFLFERALGPVWQALPEAVRRLHMVADREQVSGQAEVTRGTGPVVGIVAACFGFPKPGRKIPVRVTMQRRGDDELWVRDFGGRRFRSHLRTGEDGRVWERFGPFSFEIALGLKEGSLNFPVTAGRFLGLPMPSFLLPRSRSREFARDGRFHFDVALYLPLIRQCVVRYRGWLEPDAPVSAGSHRTSCD